MPRLPESPDKLPRVILSDIPMSRNHTGNWRSLRPVLDASRCTGCLICWKFCPEACIALTAKVPEIDYAYCKGCGICAQECPPRCIRMDKEGGL